MLRTDNSGESRFATFDKLCKENSVERHETTLYTPHQNGVT